MPQSCFDVVGTPANWLGLGTERGIALVLPSDMSVLMEGGQHQWHGRIQPLIGLVRS